MLINVCKVIIIILIFLYIGFFTGEKINISKIDKARKQEHDHTL